MKFSIGVDTGSSLVQTVTKNCSHSLTQAHLLRDKQEKLDFPTIATGSLKTLRRFKASKLTRNFKLLVLVLPCVHLRINRQLGEVVQSIPKRF